MRLRSTFAIIALTASTTAAADPTAKVPGRKLGANGAARGQLMLSSADHAGCATPLNLASDVAPAAFDFELESAIRVRVTLAPMRARASRRLEIVRGTTEEVVGCVDLEHWNSEPLEWTGVLQPDHYRALVRVATPRPARVWVSVSLRTAPLPLLRYDRPLQAKDIRPLKSAGDSFQSDALVKLSCTEEGAATEVFELPIREKSSFVVWIPPEIDDENHVFSLLRRTSSGYEELECGHQLGSVLERGSYLLVVAAAARGKAGRFSLPVRLHSLEREQRVARSARSLEFGKRKRGSTRGGHDVYNFCDIRRVGHAAPDVVYRVDVPREGTLSISVDPAGNYDGWVTIRDHNLDALEEDENYCTPFPSGRLRAPVKPGTYYAIVDGIGISREESVSFDGDFSIEVSLE